MVKFEAVDVIPFILIVLGILAIFFLPNISPINFVFAGIIFIIAAYSFFILYQRLDLGFVKRVEEKTQKEFLIPKFKAMEEDLEKKRDMRMLKKYIASRKAEPKPIPVEEKPPFEKLKEMVSRKKEKETLKEEKPLETIRRDVEAEKPKEKKEKEMPLDEALSSLKGLISSKKRKNLQRKNYLKN